MAYPELVYSTSTSPYRVTFGRNGDDLAMIDGETGERVVFTGYFLEGWTLQEIRFTGESGTVLRREQVEETLANHGFVPQGLNAEGGGTLEGTAYADRLWASAYGTHLVGGGGNDTLAANTDGGIFDLVFEGGEGDDMLHGSYARDIYRFDRGDGHDGIFDDVRSMGQQVADYFAATPWAETYQDRLEFGAGIAPGDIVASRFDDHLVLQVAGTQDKITIVNWYDGTIFSRIESFVFADGTTWLASEVDAMAGQPSVGLRTGGGGTLQGSQFDDVLTATAYGTTLLGSHGNDQLWAASDGAVFGLVFEGGRGDDGMMGSYGGDTYRFNLGDGRDAIHDDVRRQGSGVADYFAANPWAESYQDRLEFGAGIRPGDVVAERWSSDLVLRVGEGDSVIVREWFDGTMFSKIESIEFDDGTTWLASDVDAMVGDFRTPGIDVRGGGTLVGSQYSDRLTATAYGTHLHGGAGADHLDARVDDGAVFGITFFGGRGNDALVGTYAGDTYRYEPGDGHDFIFDDVRVLSAATTEFFAANPNAENYQDRLEFGRGISAADVRPESRHGNLVLHVGDLGSVTVHGWFQSGMFLKIETVAFADGTTWLASDIEAMLGVWSVGMNVTGGGTLIGSQYSDQLTANAYGTHLQGGVGNDQLCATVDGGVFNLTFSGGRGNDFIVGSYAGDTYRYELGDGHDRIVDDVTVLSTDVAQFFAANPDTESYQDRLVFGAGITAADVRAENSFGDLVLNVGEQGSVTVAGWFNHGMFRKIESVAFQDGTTWLASDIDMMLGDASSPGVQVTGGGTLAGSQYSDVLTADAYGTHLRGGAGNDHLRAAVDGGVFDLSFVGGRGNDILTGSYARDTYRYALGDGSDRIIDDVRVLGQGVADFFAANPGAETYQDRLLFGEGITADMVTRSRHADGVSLELGIAATGDSIVIDRWFDGTVFNKIELIGFADGTTWNVAATEQGLA